MSSDTGGRLGAMKKRIMIGVFLCIVILVAGDAGGWNRDRSPSRAAF